MCSLKDAEILQGKLFPSRASTTLSKRGDPHIVRSVDVVIDFEITEKTKDGNSVVRSVDTEKHSHLLVKAVKAEITQDKQKLSGNLTGKRGLLLILGGLSQASISYGLIYDRLSNHYVDLLFYLTIR